MWYMKDYDLKGIGDYDPPEDDDREEDYDEWYDGWYLFNEDRSDGYDE